MLEESKQFLLQEEKEDARTYRLSMWWVEHRAAIRRLGYGAFLFIDGVLLVFVLWTFLDSYAISYDDERRAVEALVTQGSDARAYSLARAAGELVVQEVRVFSTGDNRYDVFAMLTNEYTDWWVEFDYQFRDGETSTTPKHAVFLPGQRKPVVDLAVHMPFGMRDAELIMDHVRWHRIDHHEIGDYPTWYQKRSGLEITDGAFTKDIVADQTIGVTSFVVTNHTAYSYYQPTFFVLLKQGNTIVGVSRVTLASLDSLEKKTVSLNWFGTLPSVTTIEVIPDINFLDPSVYRRAQGINEGDIRTRPILE